MKRTDTLILDELCKGRLRIGPVYGAVRQVTFHLARRGDDEGLRIIADNLGLDGEPIEPEQLQGDVPLSFGGDAA